MADRKRVGIVNLANPQVQANVQRLFQVIGRPDVHQGALGNLFAIIAHPGESAAARPRVAAGPSPDVSSDGSPPDGNQQSEYAE